MTYVIPSEKFIEVFAPFRKSPDTLIRQILSCSNTKKFPRNTVIYMEGDPCPGIGFLLSGVLLVGWWPGPSKGVS